MADQEDSVLDILRRIEPALSGIVAGFRELREEIIEIRVAVAAKPGRA